MLKAVLFDLDGVITDTAIFHYQAWKKAANKLGGDITLEFNENLKGVDRVNSLRLILEEINIELEEQEFNEILEFKNNYFVELLNTLSEKDILPGIAKLFYELKHNDIAIVIASASKNAPMILEKINLLSLVDEIANPNDIKNGKPAPDIFLLAAKLANAEPAECIGIEDAQAGVDALNSANILSIAVGDDFNDATAVVESTSMLNLEYIKKIYNEKGVA